MKTLNTDKGLSLVELLVGIGIVGILSFVMMSMAVQMNRQVADVQSKFESQSFESLAKIVTANPSACVKTFYLDTVSFLVDKDKLPQSREDESYDVDVPKMYIAGDDIEFPKQYNKLLLQSAHFSIMPQLSKNIYPAKLNIMTNTGLYNRTIDRAVSSYISLEFEEYKPDPSKMRLVKCSTNQKADEHQVCEMMGGDWLDATQPDRFMIQPRCNLSPDVFLAYNEFPDDYPKSSSQSTNDGKKISECYYQNVSGQTLTYICSTLAGRDCRWDADKKRWTLTTGSLFCDKGVKVSTQNPGTEYLYYNELMPLTGNVPDQDFFENNTQIGNEKLETIFSRLGAIRKCRIAPDIDKWLVCNSNNYSSMVRGLASTCTFTLEMKTTGQLPTIKKCSGSSMQSCPSDTNYLYSGWIYTTRGRGFTVNSKTLAPNITDAVGYICYQIEYDNQQGGNLEKVKIISGNPSLTSNIQQALGVTPEPPNPDVPPGPVVAKIGVQENPGLCLMRDPVKTKYHGTPCTKSPITYVTNVLGALTSTAVKAGGCFYLDESVKTVYKIAAPSTSRWVQFPADTNLTTYGLKISESNPNVVKVDPAIVISAKNQTPRGENIPFIPYMCNVGVAYSQEDLVSTLAETQTAATSDLNLRFDEQLPEGMTALNTSTMNGYKAMLGAYEKISKCQTDPLNDVAKSNCDMKVDSVNESKIGTCLFVENKDMSTNSVFKDLVKKCANSKTNQALTANGYCRINPSSYTGWIQVKSPKVYPVKLNVVTATSTSYTFTNVITEAIGSPCFNVELSSPITEDDTSKYSVLGASEMGSGTTPLKCVVKSSITPSTKQSMFISKECKNEDAVIENSIIEGSKILKMDSCWFIDSAVYFSKSGTYSPGTWVRLRSDVRVDTKSLDVDGNKIYAPSMPTGQSHYEKVQANVVNVLSATQIQPCENVIHGE